MKKKTDLQKALEETQHLTVILGKVSEALTKNIAHMGTATELLLLRKKCVAFEYATTSQVGQKDKEELRRKYEKALTCMNEGRFMFDYVVSKDNSLDDIAKSIKGLKSTRYKRNKKTTAEIYQDIARLERQKLEIDKIIKIYEKVKIKLIAKEQ